MSGGEYEEICPECGSTLTCYTDWKPYSTVSGECLACGFKYWTQEGRLTLEEVNELRVDRDLEPLVRLALT